MIVEFEFSHDIDRVYSVLTDPHFLQERALKLGSLDAQSFVEKMPEHHQVTLIRKRKIKVPAILKAVLKSVQTATTQERWNHADGQYHCENSTKIEGAPLTISGNVYLQAHDTGCHFQAEFEADAKIAFIGKKMEKYAAKTIAKEIELECEYAANYLTSLAAQATTTN